MATLQFTPAMATINGTTFTQLIITPVSPPHRKQSKTILPKQEAVSPPAASTPTETDRTSQQIKLECAKRRIHFSRKALTHPRPQAVTRRNTRERNRVRAVNQGFVTLASHVPTHLRSKKMSKVDTLRAAILYIQDLQEALDTGSSVSQSSECDSPEQVSSPATSTSSSLPSSPLYHPHSPLQSAINTTNSLCQQSQIQPLYQNQYSSNMYPHNALEASHHHVNAADGSYQPQCAHSPFYTNYDNTAAAPVTASAAYHIDFSRPIDHNGNNRAYGGCPSPTESYTSASDTSYDQQQQITPEAEAELLEFASWLY